MKVGHNELADGAIDRLTVTEDGMVGFRDSAPVATNFEDGDDVIEVVFAAGKIDD